MDLNGEVPRGPLDAFFMSRPRYTPRHKWQAPQTLFSSHHSFPLLFAVSHSRTRRRRSPRVRSADNASH